MSHAASLGWHLRAGRERDHRYATIQGDDVTWTQVRDVATRFTTKAEAAVEQADIVSALGVSVAVMADFPLRVGPGPDRLNAHGESA